MLLTESFEIPRLNQFDFFKKLKNPCSAIWTTSLETEVNHSLKAAILKWKFQKVLKRGDLAKLLWFQQKSALAFEGFYLDFADLSGRLLGTCLPPENVPDDKHLRDLYYIYIDGHVKEW